MPSISFTESNVLAALRSVLMTFGFVSEDDCPVPIIKGQVNRVPPPRQMDFVVMWPISRNRLGQNVNEYRDTTVMASITNNIMNVTSIDSDLITNGVGVYSKLLPVNCVILSQRDGEKGGVGSYVVSQTDDIKNQLLYVGLNRVVQSTNLTVQCDVHGPNASDNVHRMVTLLRDWYSTEMFKKQGYEIAPLYSSDPRQLPFINAEKQYEDRWSSDVSLQINPVVTVSQQFADVLKVKTIEVDTTFLP